MTSRPFKSIEKTQSMEHSSPMAEARAFLRLMRETQARNNTFLSGRFKIADDIQAQIDSTAAQTLKLSRRAIFNASSGQAAMRTMLTRMEVVCERNGLNIDDDLRAPIARILLDELCANADAFSYEKKPAKVAPLTLYQGEGFIHAHNEPEFQVFHDTPGLIKYAAVSYPSDPRGYLRQTIHLMDRLAQDEEFRAFKSTPWVFKHAAMHAHIDPQGFLRKTAHTVQELKDQPEFAEFLEAPAMFLLAAIKYSADPQGFLHNVKNGKTRIPHWHDFKNRATEIAQEEGAQATPLAPSAV